jgi:hypothetical protein
MRPDRLFVMQNPRDKARADQEARSTLLMDLRTLPWPGDMADGLRVAGLRASFQASRGVAWPWTIWIPARAEQDTIWCLVAELGQAVEVPAISGWQTNTTLLPAMCLTLVSDFWKDATAWLPDPFQFS